MSKYLSFKMYEDMQLDELVNQVMTMRKELGIETKPFKSNEVGCILLDPTNADDRLWFVE